MLNAHQERAVALLERLLATDGKKDSNHGEQPIAFLSTQTQNPAWDERQEIWAPDWCAGWYFQPNYAHARALGVTLEKRSKVVGHYIDKDCKPVFETVKGKIKIDLKTGKPVQRKLLRYYMEWSQSTAFDFRSGYTIHRPNADLALVIEYAIQATPASKDKQRNAGLVTFCPCPRSAGYAKGKPVSMTQDEFVRYLITGDAHYGQHDDNPHARKQGLLPSIAD